MIRLVRLEVAEKQEQIRFSSLLSNMFGILENNAKQDPSELQDVLIQKVLPVYIEIGQNQAELDRIKIAMQQEHQEQYINQLNQEPRNKRKGDDDIDTRDKKKKKKVPYQDRNRFHSSIATPCIGVVNVDDNTRCGRLTNNRMGRMAICSKCKYERTKYTCSSTDCSKHPAYNNYGVLQFKCEYCDHRCYSCNRIRDFATGKTCSKCYESKTCTMCRTRRKVVDGNGTYQHAWCEECHINK